MEKMMTANEIRSAGIEALVKSLGPTGMVRFLQQFDKGSGDYTRERSEWLSQFTLEDIERVIKQRRK